MSTLGHVYAYQVTDRPDAWLRVIAPMDTIETLLAHLLEQFRGRLLALRNESDPAAVIVIGTDGRRQTSPETAMRDRA